MAEHAQDNTTPGTMDIRAQEKTYSGFLKLTKWTVVAVIAILIFMALANA